MTFTDLFTADLFSTDPIMSSADADSLVQLLLNHKYAALVAILANLTVRLLKDDTILPTVPKRWRARFLPVLAVVAIAGDRLATQHSWTEAVLDSVVGVLMAMYLHETVAQHVFPNGDLPLPDALLKRECKRNPPPDVQSDKPVPPDSPTPSQALQDSAALHRERRDLPTEPPPPPPPPESAA